ncbi:PREDICTED: uncharacterized protein LOC109213488 isoform X2 [Nicotiana attenuata]|uniref:Ribosomal protein L34Ae n=1 Tax=Nicotiana attenuata TaxID=49451 RepID=A0A1J6KEG7_NICAT|nr:PREDICTED: uncharacterized protein LOC109213488 isoform X2 [Nicotiana attenuata]OIT27782.1 hypothetical protein A4A49_25286 [Nicotiana attenuata]
MSTNKHFMLKSHFNKMFLSEFICKMTWCLSSVWGFFCSFMFKIFFLLEKYIDRMVEGDYKKNDSDFRAIQLECKSDKKLEFNETESSVFVQSKFEYIYGQDAFGFIEKPEVKSFTIQEMFVNSNEGEEEVLMAEELKLDQIRKEEKIGSCFDDSPNSKEKPFYFSFFKNGIDEKAKAEVFDEKEANDQELAEEHVESNCCEENLKQNDEGFSDKESENLEDICYEIQLFSDNQSFVRNSIQWSDTIGAEDFIISEKSSSDVHVNGFLNSDHFMENDEMGFIELETSLHNFSAMDTNEFVSKKVDRVEETDVNSEEVKLMDDFQEFQDHNSSRKSWDTDSDSDEDECDILLQHQNLVRQMKMEMKNSRITGLPTISEDCESPKVVEDLKPLKIDEKIEYKDCIEEIHKFYKSYAEKMRKLDILNYQTLNAISFLQLKDSEVFMSSKKSSISITKAFTLPSFLANKQRKIFADPAQKSISEMNRDLEIVYVGQVCLSWEILCWQYGKTKELLEHDPQEYHTYNQVAGEYQQFQVLLQRFVEDEPFQGPRVQNYVRKRCMLRSFLQVPSIRDDRSKEKQGGHEGEKDVISIVKLAEIIKETMHVFWEFLRADKRETNLGLKGVQGTQMDTAETELFMNIRSDLQKKERKLKDVQRSGNCIVKKFQKQQEGRLSHPLFTSLVELRLVSRVLSLPRVRRDHLVWCQKKLSNINVVGRKVSMEPCFSLFPC